VFLLFLQIHAGQNQETMQNKYLKATDTAPETFAPGTANSNESRRSYTAPRIISVEKLEAAASSCSSGVGNHTGGGKVPPANQCGTPGS